MNRAQRRTEARKRAKSRRDRRVVADALKLLGPAAHEPPRASEPPPGLSQRPSGLLVVHHAIEEVK